MVRSLRLLAALAVAASTALAAVATTGARAAGADQCLPPPQILFSEVARVAGTGSKVWADLQAVGDTDAAQGTSGPGQVLTDLLAAAARDGYQWDCAGMQLIPPANAPPRNDLPPATTPPPATTATAGGTGKPATGLAGTTTGNADPATTAATGQGAPDAAGATGVPTTEPAGASVLAGPASTNRNVGGIPIVVLIALAVLSGLVIVLVVRRQLSRH